MNHVCLVSEQPMPNFLPVLNHDLRPDSVTLVVSGRMKDRAQWLRTEIEKQQVRVLDDIDIGDDVSNINEIQKRLLEWADGNGSLMDDSVLNATGGTKTMAIAAQEVFRMAGRDVFYVDVATDKVTWVSGSRTELRLTNEPTLNQFFGLHGITMVGGDFRSELPQEKWRDFYRELAGDMPTWASRIGKLNFYAHRAEEIGSLDINPPEKEANLPGWTAMIKLSEHCELVRKDRGRLRFCSAEARKFCNGVWLEHHVFETLKQFGFDKKRALMNVEIEDSKGNRNELDAVVLHGNTCFVIEDKTRNMKKNNVADAAVYKLAHLSRTMGLRAQGLLISAMEIRPEDKQRAQAYGVRIIDSLSDLKSQMKSALKI